MKPFNLREHHETITSTNTLITNAIGNQKKPIMSNKVKLYTEEQVKVMLGKARLHEMDDAEMFTDDYLIEQQVPIELPSDEEIKTMAIKSGLERISVTFGADWVINKIKNQVK